MKLFSSLEKSVFYRQVRVLSTKNWLLSKRNFKGTIGQLIAPFIIVVMLFGFQKLSNYVLSRDNPYPTPYELGNYPKCIERNNVECITLMYAPNDTEWVNTLMEVVSLRAGLEFGKDVVGVGHGNLTQLDAIIYDNATIYTHIVDNQNLTQNALIFWGAYLGDLLPMTPSGLPLDVGYLLWYNMTADNPYAMELMRLVDETVLLLQQNLSRKGDVIPQDKTYVKASYSEFPVQKLRIAGYDVVAANGGVWFYIPPMITFFILLTELVMEKENHLRIGMRVMGLQNSAYWVVWFITGFVFVLLSTLILIATGSMFQFSFFLNSNFFALFLLFFFFGMAMLSLCFLISTFVESSKTAQTIGYAFILVGFVFQVILCSMNGALIDLLYAKEVHTWVKFIRMVFTFYPPFNLAMGFSNIAAVSSDVINIAAGMITSGPGFRFSDLFVRRSVPSLFGLHMTVPTPFQTILTLIANSVFFLILAWYFDNVISAGQGVSRHPLFFLQAEYWGLTKKGKSSILSNQDQQERIANESALKLLSTDSDVRNEAEMAVKNNRNVGINSSSSSSSNPNAFSGIRVVGLTKVYHPHFSFIKFVKKLFDKLFSKKGQYTKVDVDQKSDDKENDLLAVDNLSIMIEEGQIFSVLGHNGAGKTTTINMLTGLFPPTSGFSYIYGKSILTDMDEIRKMVGVCPQHDILYNELTANEHLRLFAKLKGIENVEQEIKTRLDYMGLSKVGDHRVGSFSGGMKRRLSVAISAIGDPKVIFLDEPTTGMDVVNRASVWTMIQNMKHNRVIVLTTHSMQEADVLSDRISIMSFGKLCAIGSSLHLKNKFGTGYRINAATRIDQVQNITRELTTIIPDMAQGANNAGSVTWHIPVSNRDKMPEALQFLESQDDKTVREWGVACSSLEEVFLDVTKNTGFHYDDIEGESSVVAPSSEIHIESENLDTVEAKSHRESTVGKKPPKSNVYRALLRKNFTLQKRQTGTNFCQIITPVLVMAILVLLRLIIKSQLGDQANAKVLIPSIPIPINLPLSSIPNIPTSISQSETYFPFFKSLNKVQPSNPLSFNELFEYKDHLFPTLLPTLPPIPSGNSSINITFPSDGNCLEFFYFSDSTFNHSAGFLNSTGSGSGLLGNMKSRQTPCILLGGTVVEIPYFEELGSLQIIDKTIFDTLGVYNAQPIRSIDHPPFNYMLPDGALDFSYLEPKNSRLDYTFTVNENPIVRYHRKNNFTRVSISFLDLSENEFSIMIPHGQLSLMDLVHQAFAGEVLGQSLSLLSLKLCQPMPYFDSADILGLLEAFGTVLYPVALTLQLPIYIYILAMEKSEKLKEMMKQHGMKNSSYIITNYIFDMSLYIVVVAFFWIVGVLVNIRFFTQTNWLTLFLVFFGWGNSLISLAFALSTFINSKRAAVILGYVVALFGSLMGIVLVGIYGDIPLISISPRLPVAYLAWPQIAFVRAIYLLNNACALEFSCYGSPSLIPKGDEMINVLISLYISPIAYFVLYLYLDQVVRNDFGVPKHPLFFLLPIWNKIKALIQSRSQVEKDSVLLINSDEESSLESSKKILSVKNSGEDFKGPDSHEDKDIVEERERVYARNYPPDSPLVIIDLRKEYPPNTPKGAPKIAVSNLTLAVPNGQCFGLLGENGAGKTTTISILTGLITPTSGKAFVGGFSILSDIDKAQLVMGVCPQFNILWDSLSVREHMLFYARLKGVSPSNELEHVNQMLHELGLLHAANRRASDLSGGMKRRLSVGIALIGYSRIVFLDEPTTGMDIASRRQLWSIINRAKAGRVIILTTHSMEEAELLCDNIGIMALGKLRALGTQQHLKSTLGESYQLQISFKSQDESMATNLVHTLFPGCKLVRSYKGWAQFEIARDQVRVSDVFARMEKESSQGGILDWSCNQVGLEEVFQRVVFQSNQEKDSDEIEMASF